MSSPQSLPWSEWYATVIVSGATFPIFALCSKAAGIPEAGSTLQSLLGASQEAHLDAVSIKQGAEMSPFEH